MFCHFDRMPASVRWTVTLGCVIKINYLGHLRHHVFNKVYLCVCVDGVFLNISSSYARTGSGYVVPSACAKAGVEALTK